MNKQLVCQGVTEDGVTKNTEKKERRKGKSGARRSPKKTGQKEALMRDIISARWEGSMSYIDAP